jgi:hypothetical protein
MGSAEIGGDSSVEWDVISHHPRPNVPVPPAPVPGAARHHGIDGSGFGAANGFFIDLEMPMAAADAAAFVNSLTAACALAQAQQGNPGAVISFTLPIEQNNPNQIKVRWISAPDPAPARNLMGAMALAKPGVRVAAKRPPKAAKRSAKKLTKKKAAKKRRA